MRSALNIRDQLLLRSLLPMVAYEYLLITLPVALYVFMEASRKEHVSILWRTPEWAIATVFLIFQGLSLYFRRLNRAGAQLSPAVIGLLVLIGLIITAATLINAYRSLDEAQNTRLAIAFRLALFTFVSLAFFLFVISAQLYYLRKGLQGDGQT